jgi:hypothetical protein
MAWLSSLRDRLAAFTRLPGDDRIFLIRAWFALIRTSFLLRVRSLNALWTACVRRSTRRRGAPGEVRDRDLERAARLVDVAGRHHFLQGTCLERSLTLAWLLAGKGIRTELQIGVRSEARGLAAHAWLAYGGRPLTDIPEGETYHPLEPAA